MSRWPEHKAYFWEAAPFFRILAPFALGIFLYLNPWGVRLPLVGVAATALASVVVYLALVGVNMQKGSFVVANLALVTLGFSIAGYNDVRSRHNWFGHAAQPGNTYLATITTAPEEKNSSWKLQVRTLWAMKEEQITTAPGNAFVYVRKTDLPMLLQKGDTVLLPGRWEPIKDAGNPFEFSYAAYCAHNNIFHTQWCAPEEVRLYAQRNIDAAPLTEKMHDWCMRQLDKRLGGHKARGLLQAMLMGDEVNLDKDLQHAYAETGILHIIAISGGNVAVFFIVISTLLGWLKHKRYTWIKYVVAMPIVWFYVLAAGAQPSAIRAAAMFSLLSFGIITRRNSNNLNELFATAFVLLCAEPAWLLSIGFQLSFAAVLSIVLFYKHVYAWLPFTQPKISGTGIVAAVKKVITGLPFKLWRVIAMSIAAEILIAPLVIYYFHSFPVMFIAANAAGYLFMSFVLMQGMVMLALSGIPAISGGISEVIKALTEIFSSLVGAIQDIGPTSFRHISLSTLEIIILYSALADMAYFLLRKYKPALFASVGALCLLMVSRCVNEWDTLNQRRLVIYNTPHSCHAEIEEGDRYSVICTDTAHNSEIDYATSPAHTGWNAWQQHRNHAEEVCCVGGKSLLFLNGGTPQRGRFPVDYLVLNDPANTDVKQLSETFSPSMIVVSNSLSRKEIARVSADCRKLGIAVHAVADSGAFVLSQ